jgi:hypothetical protein
MYTSFETAVKQLVRIDVPKIIVSKIEIVQNPPNVFSIYFKVQRKKLLGWQTQKVKLVYNFELLQKKRDFKPSFPENKDIVEIKVIEAIEYIKYTASMEIDGRDQNSSGLDFNPECSLAFSKVTSQLQSDLENISRSANIEIGQQLKPRTEKTINVEYVFAFDKEFESILKKKRNDNGITFTALYVYQLDNKKISKKQVIDLFKIQGVPVFF